MARLCKLTPTCLTVVDRLLDLDQADDGYFWVTAETVAWETGHTVDAVFDAFDRLEKVGLVRRIKKPYNGKPGKIKHTKLTPAFYQIIDWAEEAWVKTKEGEEEKAHESEITSPRKIHYDAVRLATLLKSHGWWAKVLAEQAEHDPDTQEIPDRVLRNFPTECSGISRMSTQEIPDRIPREFPTEKSKKNSRETKKRRGEGISLESPEEQVLHSNGSDRSNAPAQRDTEAETIWKTTHSDLSHQLPASTYEQWVHNTKAKEINPDTNELIIEAPHAYARAFLQGRLTNKITKLLPGELKPRFTSPDDQEQPQLPIHDRPRPPADIPPQAQTPD